jgi:phosphoribosylformimino-5-aminoimidazole carboxamide ribotide isomerase
MVRRRFEVIPAVDVLGEQAVRLERGDYEHVTLRAGGPLELVERFAGYEPRWIHFVDLDGARSGQIRPELVEAAARAADAVPLQASGGIRSMHDARALLGAGAGRVVVGTAAFAGDGPGWYARALGDRLVVAIDVRDGLVAVDGWLRTTEVTADEAAVRCAEAGVQRILCTAIEHDGTLGGPDLELLARIKERVDIPVLAAGGISSVEDLAALETLGIEGAVVGLALLDGRLSLDVLGPDGYAVGTSQERPNAVIASTTGNSPRPFSVSSYSTLGGDSG